MWRHIAFVSGLSIHMSISQSIHHAFICSSYHLNHCQFLKLCCSHVHLIEMTCRSFSMVKVKVAGQRFMSAPYFIVLYTSTSPLISQADQIGPNKKNTCV